MNYISRCLLHQMPADSGSWGHGLKYPSTAIYARTLEFCVRDCELPRKRLFRRFGDSALNEDCDFAGLRVSSTMKLTPRRKGTRLDEVPPVEIQVPRITVYRECLKNYAAKTGGHVLDGCQEFIARGEEGSLDALKCATCDCHRNFHRKEVVGCHCQHVCNEREPTLGAISHPPLAAPAATNSGLSESDDQEGSTSASDAATKKRFRTQYSTEQKEKMYSFAEALGWRIQKHDESIVESFCAEIGISRHALKGWMRNNKHTSGKKDLE